MAFIMSKTDLVLQVSNHKKRRCENISGKCKECGKKTWTDEITHCSNKCLFADIQNSKSMSGIPVETCVTNQNLRIKYLEF